MFASSMSSIVMFETSIYLILAMKAWGSLSSIKNYFQASSEGSLPKIHKTALQIMRIVSGGFLTALIIWISLRLKSYSSDELSTAGFVSFLAVSFGFS